MAMRMLFIGAGVLALLSVILAWKWIKEPKAKIDRKEVANVVKLPLISF
jgi:hypothetical protein